MSLTINQTIKNRSKRKKKSSRNVFGSSPQKRGVCIEVKTVSPKKPNSAKRKICKVKLSNNLVVSAYIPGENHNLQEHSYVLLRHGKTQDTPGLRYKVIRGKFDCNPVEKRKSSCSKYGTKRKNK